jgi:hypothetical protein
MQLLQSCCAQKSIKKATYPIFYGKNETIKNKTRFFYSNVTFNDDKSIHNYAILKLQLCIFQSRQIAGIL